MKSIIKTIIKFVIGFGALAFLISKIDIDSAIRLLPSININYIFVALVFYLLFFLTSAFCIQLLSDQFKKLPFWKIFWYYLYSWAIGLLLPSKLGELSLAYFLKRDKIRLGNGLAISLIDKLITVALFSIIALFGIFLFFDIALALRLSIILVILGVIFIILIKWGITDRLTRFLPKSIKSHFRDISYGCMFFLTKRKGIMVINFITTIVRWIFNGLMSYYIFLSLGIIVNLVHILVVATIASLISLVPISINGLGIRQSIGVYLFSVLSVDAVYAFNMFLIQLVLSYTIAAVILLFLIKEGMKIGQISADTP